jgi:cell division protein ZapA
VAQVTIRINGYSYTVGCEDGQEEHLQLMASEVDTRINSLRALGGSAAGESRMLVLAALLMADELHDLAVELAAVKARDAAARDEALAARRMARLAKRAEGIADKIQPAGVGKAPPAIADKPLRP